jgi:UDP-glucose 4-epimerase
MGVALVVTAPRALVTGASGFVGQRLLAHLHKAGYQLTVLVHRQAPVLPSGAQARIYQGDLLDAGLLSQACDGVDVIFHLAALAHINQANSAEMRRINVQGTAVLLEAAIAAGVRRIVYFSSILAETRSSQPRTAYGDSKREAECLLLNRAADAAIEVCILRPANVYGAGMKGNLATMIRLIDRGLFPPLPRSSSRLSLLHVDDLCQAAVLAAEAPQANGQIYPVTDGVDYSMQSIERSIRQALGRAQPGWSIPRWMLFAAALKLELIGRIFRLKNAPGLRSYRALTADNAFSCEKISHDLGYNPRASFFRALEELLPSLLPHRLSSLPPRLPQTGTESKRQGPP